ncbi:related to Vacuolar protein sorting-associated protein 28 [Saccharomycodes ludwigii]|uniref:Vacuolar protein sorting-associated protein 28 n=1 Tax=Saccharomycodes ludwigii TaxID=36035 RepID=A0A376B714_9ASCO|nr:hypothetical protein SCDLUD_002000 [Saccharomycodes ludwigii]KAH3902185.1 hypothetical protein SCDLUD_002000 [Saccharomycodes ludwigii]SSD59880.1 related to Vacuolar protein sorting-associated protein 28 [Saccharomycodes ludwigii]
MSGTNLLSSTNNSTSRTNVTFIPSDILENLAELYSIIVAIDKLEKLFLKDNVSDKTYTIQMNKLLAQYKILLSDERTRSAFGDDLEFFIKKYNIRGCSNAINRLQRGIPATIEHFSGGSTTSDSNSNGTTTINAKGVAETTGNFITVMDALKLNYRSKEQLHPLMSDLLLSINKVLGNNSGKYQERSKLVEWIVKINKLKIDECLTDNEVREMLFDLDTAYKGFYSLLD